MTTTTTTQTARLVNIYLAFHLGTGPIDARDIVRGTGAYGVLDQAIEAAARTPECIGLIVTDVITGETYASAL